MKVGVYLQTWHVGGVAVFCERLAAGLARLGHAPCLLLGTPYGKRDEPGRRAFERLLVNTTVPVHCLHTHAYHPRERGWCAADKIAALGCDALLVSAHREIVSGLAGLAPTTPLVGIAHNDEEDTFAEFSLSQSHCDAYVAVSSTVLDQLLARRAASATVQLRRIWSGVPAAMPGASAAQDAQARVLVVCRLEHRQKRVLDLPEIWRQYREAGGTGRLTICGTGCDEMQLREAFREGLAHGSVRWLGAVPSDEMPRVYAEHDFLLSVAAYEGLPLVVLEAARAGLYPVLSRIRSGHAEIVAALGAGDLCEVGDTAAFANALLRWTHDLGRARELAPQIQQRTDHLFSLERMTQDYVDLLVEVLRNRSAHPPLPRPGMNRPKVDPVRRFLRRWKYSRYYGWHS